MTPVTVETQEELKARGAFYTPPEVTRFLARWAVREADERVLEPSCGDGAFVAALAERYRSLGCSDVSERLYGVELDAREAQKAQALAPTSTIRVGSFFELTPEGMPVPTAVIGNPPFIRYHGWVGEARAMSLRRASELGVELSGLASSWAAFVIWATAFLPTAGGRLALVLPAELLHADYAEPVRRFLRRRFSSVVLIAFDRRVFAGAQVDAVLLLASDDDDAGLRVVRLGDESGLATLDVTHTSFGRHEPGARWSRSLDADSAALNDGLMRSGRVVALGSIASVDIGFVTGANHYFVLNSEAVRRHRLPADVLWPVVERPSDLAGLAVLSDELRWLFRPPEEGPWSPSVRAYLTRGRRLEIPTGYKAGKRRVWYRVPLPKQDVDAFLPYMAHRTVRLILNPVGALSTNLVHGVGFAEHAPEPRVIAAAMLSAATALSAEIEGRSYGGGVLKLETKEAERLSVPIADAVQAHRLTEVFPELDSLVRTGAADTASALVDELLGLDHESLAEAARVYRDRRIGRKGRRLTSHSPGDERQSDLAGHSVDAPAV